ncbi:basic proline-rich protein-like [Vulpes lagopus]|uniref:basic proline-rich protein-like n=1 Tax=Vulpes lagopus TaxID=494514 RepID=UPI001BC985BE|nr:basic proline-rich protein-like [Vulpes lagopus]
MPSPRCRARPWGPLELSVPLPAEGPGKSRRGPHDGPKAPAGQIPGHRRGETASGKQRHRLHRRPPSVGRGPGLQPRGPPVQAPPRDPRAGARRAQSRAPDAAPRPPRPQLPDSLTALLCGTKLQPRPLPRAHEAQASASPTPPARPRPRPPGQRRRTRGPGSRRGSPPCPARPPRPRADPCSPGAHARGGWARPGARRPPTPSATRPDPRPSAGPAARSVPRRGGAPQPASMRLLAPPDGADRGRDRGRGGRTGIRARATPNYTSQGPAREKPRPGPARPRRLEVQEEGVDCGAPSSSPRGFAGAGGLARTLRVSGRSAQAPDVLTTSTEKLRAHRLGGAARMGVEGGRPRGSAWGVRGARPPLGAVGAGPAVPPPASFRGLRFPRPGPPPAPRPRAPTTRPPPRSPRARSGSGGVGGRVHAGTAPRKEPDPAVAAWDGGSPGGPAAGARYRERGTCLRPRGRAPGAPAGRAALRGVTARPLLSPRAGPPVSPRTRTRRWLRGRGGAGRRHTRCGVRALRLSATREEPRGGVRGGEGGQLAALLRPAGSGPFRPRAVPPQQALGLASLTAPRGGLPGRRPPQGYRPETAAPPPAPSVGLPPSGSAPTPTT